MPIYEYCCEKGHVFELFQSIGAQTVPTCEICQSPARRKPSLFNQPKKAGVYVFDRKYGFKDVLHDPSISERERDAAISEIAGGLSQSEP